MEQLFAERIRNVRPSFIREILKVSLDPEIISFAGGLPNPKFFPVAEMEQATEKVFSQFGPKVMQYSNSEGDIDLRNWISRRYRTHQDLDIPAENILITNGSQQGLDLLAKVFLNPGDRVLIEEPGYLGAIQSLSLYSVLFRPVPLGDEGLDIERLAEYGGEERVKCLYCVPNFQNPSGRTYTADNRQAIADIARKNGFVLIEDDPYGALRFTGSFQPCLASFLPEQTVLLGSFSKVVVPGFRLGWIAAPKPICEKLLIAKQAADLHTSGFTQKIVLQYLLDNDLDHHIRRITDCYGGQCRAMQDALANCFPEDVSFTRPEGGMFLWGNLPGTMDSMELFKKAVQRKVVFVPGAPFYTGDEGKRSSFRLNFSCVDEQTTVEGVNRLSAALVELGV